MDRLLVTCEHAGHVVPSEFAHLFVEHGHLLPTHRGWDPGALTFARELAKAHDAPLHYDTVTRLVADLNRSRNHPGLHAPEIRDRLSEADRQRIVERYWQPHRQRVDAAVASLAKKGRVLHLASHSFTPVLDGVVRTCDVGILYDPRRAGEKAFARAWMKAIAALDPSLRVRRNYPYTGVSDGIQPPLRRQYPPDRYIGLELELNQRYAEAGGREFARVRRVLLDSFGMAMQAIARQRF